MKLVKEIKQETSDKIKGLFYKKEALSKLLANSDISNNRDAMECAVNLLADAQATLDMEMDVMEKEILKDKYKRFDYTYQINFFDHTVEFETENKIWTCLAADYGFRIVEE